MCIRDRWEGTRNHLPALAGLLVTALCLILTGSDNFLLFSMAGILLFLLLFRRQCAGKGKQQ